MTYRLVFGVNGTLGRYSYLVPTRSRIPILRSMDASGPWERIPANAGARRNSRTCRVFRTMYGVPGFPFLWEDGVLTDLGTLGGSRSIAWDINDAGQITGSSFTDGVPGGAFLWEDEVMSGLGALGISKCEAFSINATGQIVGFCHPIGGRTPVLWEDGGIVDLGALIEGDASIANAINNSGQILMYGYLYDSASGTVSLLDDLVAPDNGWSFLAGRDLNNKGQIVGDGWVNGQLHGFLMTPPPPIPTVSVWGAVLMGLALLTAATLVFGGRKCGAAVLAKES